MELRIQLYVPAALPSGMAPLYPLAKGLGGLQGRWCVLS
jgi:hypothetical protein